MARSVRIPMIGMRVPTIDTRTALPPPKQADDHYGTPEHKAWAAGVVGRAGFRCEAVDGGVRCPRGRQTGDRLYADHIKEKRDGGDLLDPANGKCLCASHHVLKTMQEKAKRRTA